MATPFSVAIAIRSTLQPKQYPHRSFLFFGDSYNGESLCPKCKPSRVNVYSWSSSASYVKLKDGNSNFLGKPILSRRILQKRGGTVKAATIEEIEAEKSSIEKDVVSLSVRNEEWKRLLKLYDPISIPLELAGLARLCWIRLRWNIMEPLLA